MTTAPLSGGIPIMLRDMQIDDVDGGLPLLTITRPEDDSVHLFRLAPDAVRALVDGLSGVAPAAPGECRIIVKGDAATLAKALLAIRDNPDAPAGEPRMRAHWTNVLTGELAGCRHLVSADSHEELAWISDLNFGCIFPMALDRADPMRVKEAAITSEFSRRGWTVIP